MPRYLTGSRVSKPVTQAGHLRSSSSSPLSTRSRSKPTHRQTAIAAAYDEDVSDDDDASGMMLQVVRAVSTFNVTSAQDVTSAMQYAIKVMFSALPQRAGMNSTRIAEVLNFQKSLPQIVSIAHVHAIISASSKTEREIQNLLQTGKLLKLRVTGRGNDITGLSEVLILLSDYKRLLEESGLPDDVVAAFLRALSDNPRASSISSQSLPTSMTTVLTRSGFLVSSSLLGSRNLSLSGSSLTGIPMISRAISGTKAAVGGEAAFETLGGVGSGQRSKQRSNVADTASELVLSAPNIGIYLRLLEAGRNHLLELLRLSKHRQAPLYLLRERWDGAIDSDSSVSQAKRLRGEFSQVLPAKTKKWKDLKGLSFDWALEECLGAGMIEAFETHSVGLGIRAIS